MRKRNIFLRFIGFIARKFRAFQEEWIIPLWGGGVLVAIPLWSLDTLVLVVKLCSVCAISAIRILIPATMKNLYGETVLITGAGAGIGRELAIQFADLGATVICWDKDVRRNNAVVEEITNRDGDCYGYTIDVTVREQVFSLASRMRRQLMEVTMVVSSAGATKCGPLLHVKSDVITKLIEKNLMAHFWVIQAFLPNMIERRHGHIVAINSSAGLMPCPDMVPFSAAKFGLRGIRKNRKCICMPSYMKPLIDLNTLMPYRIRIIFTDFFNFGHRTWFCFC